MRPLYWVVPMVVLALGLPAEILAGPTSFQAARAQPRVEYWQDRQDAIEKQLSDPASLPSVKLLFIGDSITDFFEMKENRWVKGVVNGGYVWAETFIDGVPANRALNLGISGDRTEHILHRLAPRSEGGRGELDATGLDPDYVIVMAGINNSWGAEEPVADSVYAGVEAIIASVHARKPRSRIILQTLLPTNEAQRNADVVDPVNARLAKMVTAPALGSSVRILDLHASFIDASGKQIARYFYDGLHPNQEGYGVWRDRLLAFLDTDRAARTKAVQPK